MKKQVVNLLLVAVMLVFASGMAQAADKKIGVMWIGKSGVAESVSQGLISVLEEKAPGIEIEIRPTLDDEAAATELFNQWQDEKDGIVFLRSTGAKYFAKHDTKVPGFCGACTNPVVLGATSSLEKPSRNVTGVSYYIPAGKQLDIFKSLTPDMKSVALITEEGHPASPLDQEETEQWCEDNGVEFVNLCCTSQKDVLKEAKRVRDDVDFFVLGNESMVQVAGKHLSKISKRPIYSFNVKPLKAKSAVCGLVSDNVKRGQLLADSVIAVVLDGKDVADVPVILDPNPVFTVVPEVAEQFEVAIPEEMMTGAEVID